MNKIFLAFLIVFTSAQALALPLAPELVDQIKKGDQVYNVVIDDIVNIDETTGSEVTASRKSGYLEVHLSVYKENNTEFTRRQGSAIFLSTFKVCDEIAKKSKNYIKSINSGYKLHTGAENGYSIEGFLSDDKKTYSCSCNVPYTLKSK